MCSNGIENTISGPATLFKVDPVVAARAGFTPQEIELDASAILQGEPATTPVVVNDRAYTIRVRFPEQTRASVDAIRNTLLVSAHRQDRHARLAGHGRGDSRPDRNPAREPAAQRHGDGAPRRRRSRQRHRGGAAGDRRSAPAAGDPRRVRRRLRGAAEIVPGSAARAGPGRRAGLHGAAVRVRRTSPRRSR